MRVVAIIQARMGSTRLPGKVMKDLLGKPVLIRDVNRIRRAKCVDEVATSIQPEVTRLPRSMSRKIDAILGIGASSQVFCKNRGYHD